MDLVLKAGDGLKLTSEDGLIATANSNNVEFLVFEA